MQTSKSKRGPMLTINMYNDEDTNDENDDISSECKQLISADKSKSYVSPIADIESELLSEDIDAAGLKMVCLERIKMIEDDLNDPDLSTTERIIHQMNINSLKTVVGNARLSEKIKLGSLQSSQYTDAVILQKQIACNFAGQREYSDVIKPVIYTQPVSEMSLKGTENNEVSECSEMNTRAKNNITQKVAAM